MEESIHLIPTTKEIEYTFPLKGCYRISAKFNEEKKELIVKCEETESGDLVPIGTLTINNNTFSTNFYTSFISDLKKGHYVLYIKKGVDE